jgi:CBS domain-containing protein
MTLFEPAASVPIHACILKPLFLLHFHCGAHSEDNVVGVITEFDLLKAVKSGKDLWDTAVWELMTKGAITADVSATVSEIATIMTEKNIHRLPITKEGKLVGIVARPDILKSQMNPSVLVL